MSSRKLLKLDEAYKDILETPGAFYVYSSKHGLIEPQHLNRYYPLSKVKSANEIGIIPGTFNPLHETHKEIYEIAQWQTDVTFFEVSIERVNKNILLEEDLKQKLKQFDNYADVIISKESRFVTKIGAYKHWLGNLKFHIGIDTATRMADDYGVVGIQGLRADFVVYDRIFNDKKMSLETEFLDHIPINCTRSSVERSKNSMMRSSTELRENKV